MTFDINLISALSILAPLVLGAIFYNGLLSASKLIYFFILLTFGLELTARILSENGMNNMFIFHIHAFLEFYFWVWIYYRLNPSIGWHHMSIALSVLFGVGSIIALLFVQGIQEFNAVQRIIEALLLGIVFTRHLTQSFRVGIEKMNSAYFVQTIVLLLYFSGTLFLFSFGVELLKNERNYFWIIHAVFNILLNISIAYTLWKTRIRL